MDVYTPAAKKLIIPLWNLKDGHRYEEILKAYEASQYWPPEKLKELQGCEVHLTHMPTPGDEAGLRRLGVNVTSDPNFSTNSLFAG